MSGPLAEQRGNSRTELVEKIAERTTLVGIGQTVGHAAVYEISQRLYSVPQLNAKPNGSQARDFGPYCRVRVQ